MRICVWESTLPVQNYVLTHLSGDLNANWVQEVGGIDVPRTGVLWHQDCIPP